MSTSSPKQNQIRSPSVRTHLHLRSRSMAKSTGSSTSISMPDGFATNSNSRSDGKDSRRSTTPGRTLMTSTPTRDPTYYKKTTMISIWKRIFIKDTQMRHDELILRICVPDRPGNVEYTSSPQGPWTLGRGYCDDYRPFPSPAPHTTTSRHLVQMNRDPHNATQDSPDPILQTSPCMDLCLALRLVTYEFR